MSRKILFLTLYYPPDLCAGSFRAEALVRRLRDSNEQLSIDVLTALPSRYSSFTPSAPEIELQGSVRVRRFHLASIGVKSGVYSQAKLFLSFAFAVLKTVRLERYDLVLATSSRLMTAVLGAWIAYRQGARLYLDIRDIFVENLGELFSAPVSKPLTMVFGALERWAIRRADKVNLVTAGFLGYFQPRYPEQRFSLYSNGVDDDFLNFPIGGAERVGVDRPLRILYAGNIGDGQGLHLIVPELARRLSGRVHFRIVGAGGRLEALRAAVAFSALDNVELVAPVAREQLLAMYHQADVLFLHLNDFEAFRRVLPSKLFEYAATGKPIWAGVAGYAADFVCAEISNAAVFAPCDIDGAVEALGLLSLEQVPRPVFVERYARSRIMRAMAEDVLTLVEDVS